ncbi:TerB family tellurite resistance protein [Desulforegula conservatrix]|uniref:TerB family tellurite resistance protein n=1 Tax=Desulforegula conservatrix TaxID=153026 RepID=UPI00040B5E54|nr:TerB family tellurite resistance protein [Desulforegula conservatrix]
MGWTGKFVGAAIGFFWGGPIGALIGAAIGHQFDKSKTSFFWNTYTIETNDWQENHNEANIAFFVSVFSMLAKMAKSDGAVSQAEIESVESFMKNQLHLDARGRNFAINIFRSALNSPESFDSFARQFYYRFQYDPELLEMMVDMLLRVGYADGEITRSEEELAYTAARIFGISSSAFEYIKSRYAHASKKSYVVLGVDEDSSDAEIKSRYRKLVHEYHPDKLAAKGVPDEFARYARERFGEIQSAYEEIRKERGF